MKKFFLITGIGKYDRSGLGLNTTFNNISVITWQSVLFVEDTGVPGVNR